MRKYTKLRTYPTKVHGNMNWEDLRYFVAIAHAGTVSGAARQLGVDQATVSRRLAALEADLGARLVDRQPRRAALTALGEQILSHSLEIENQVFAVKRLALNARVQSRAKITISAPPSSRGICWRHTCWACLSVYRKSRSRY